MSKVGGILKERKVKVVEEDLLHLKMELVVALKSRHLHLVMLQEEQDGIEDKEPEAKEMNFDASNVTK